MTVDIHALAQRANQSLSAQAGFLGCAVHDSAKRVLAYTFSDDVSAHQFQGQRELAGMHAVIHDADPSVVLVTHP